MKKHKMKFLMDTDWLFQGILDAEQKEYVLLSYFQKLNQKLEEMKVYPMFTELSLHLGNIQTLLTRKQLLYTDKKFSSTDEEITFKDLKTKDIPPLSEQEYFEFQKILQYSQPKLLDYFNIAKALWTLAYDSIVVTTKKNKNNLNSKTGFFYFERGDMVYIYQYLNKNKNKVTTSQLKEIYVGEKNLTISKLLSKFSPNYKKEKQNLLPVFEVKGNEIFPIEETLLPIFKRKVLNLVIQSKKVEQIETIS
jgi:hypothetical protein